MLRHTIATLTVNYAKGVDLELIREKVRYDKMDHVRNRFRAESQVLAHTCEVVVVVGVSTRQLNSVEKGHTSRCQVALWQASDNVQVESSGRF